MVDEDLKWDHNGEKESSLLKKVKKISTKNSLDQGYRPQFGIKSFDNE